MLRQRRPRQIDLGYLKWLRAQRCACGCLQGPPCDAAHLRASSYKHDKPMTGISAKPDDKWALPLKHQHHMEQHRQGNEIEWWRDRGIRDPFQLCIDHYRRYKNGHD
jgi:hypothetical protein